MPIQTVAVVSTGSVEIRPQHVRSNRTPLWWWLTTSRRWTPPRPINVYVIEHTAGLVLFDAGQDRKSVTDPEYFPGGIVGWLYRRLARFTLTDRDTLSSRLADAGFDIADVHTVVLSHLHQDHIGGLRELGHARVVVSSVERAEVKKKTAVLDGFLARHINLPGLKWSEVVFNRPAEPSLAPFAHTLDLLGDESLTLISTPGHTPGSISLLLRQQRMPPLLFVGDLTYDVDLLSDENVPGVGKRSVILHSSQLVNEYQRRHPDLVVLAAHDPAASGLLRQALMSKSV